MDVVFLIGRILFGVLFIVSGSTAHLGEGGKVGQEYARSLGAPAPHILVPLSGVAIIAGGLMIIFGVWADLGAILIIGFLISITPIMHAFWKIEDQQMMADSVGDVLQERCPPWRCDHHLLALQPARSIRP